MKIRISEIGRLPTAERAADIRTLSVATQRPLNGEVKNLEREIRAYEARHGFSSKELRQRLAEGRIEETEDVCRWLMRLKLRDRLVELRT